MSKDTRRHHDSRKKRPHEIRMPHSHVDLSDTIAKNPATKKKVPETDRTGGSRQNSTTTDQPRTLESMMLDIERRQRQYEQEQALKNDEDSFSSGLGDEQERSRKTFYREFKKVIDAADIIIEVLDARDPLGCRCAQVEEIVLTSGKNKKLILLLNKIDLIPRDNLDRWLKYLRNEFPTIAFRSSTQTQRDRLGHMNVSLKACDEQLLKTSNKCIGALTLMNLLSNYCRKNDIKTSITVGIVGYPNVGKSSVINSLKRSQACETGSMPGLTKQMQTVKLDKLIKLLDCPGIVMSKDTNPASLILRNCVRIETVDDPLPAIELLLQRCSKDQMQSKYHLGDFHDAQEFLSQLAVKIGCLRKGGVPDIHKAAHKVLFDWNHGRLTYFTEPPERPQEIISTELVHQFRDAFDIDALLEDEQQSEEMDEISSAEDTATAKLSDALESIVRLQ